MPANDIANLDININLKNLETDIARTTLRTRQLEAGTERAEREFRQLNRTPLNRAQKEVRKLDKEVRELGGTTDKTGALLTGAMAGFAGVITTTLLGAMSNAVAGFSEMIRSAETMRGSLISITGSADKARESFNQFQDIGDRTGRSVIEVGSHFAILNGFLQGTQLEGQGVIDILEGFSKQATITGQEGDKLKAVFDSLAPAIAAGEADIPGLIGAAREVPGVLEEISRAAQQMGITSSDSLTELADAFRDGARPMSDFLSLLRQSSINMSQQADVTSTAILGKAKLANAWANLGFSISEANQGMSASALLMGNLADILRLLTPLITKVATGWRMLLELLTGEEARGAAITVEQLSGNVLPITSGSTAAPGEGGDSTGEAQRLAEQERAIGNARLDALQASLDQLREEGRITQEIYDKENENIDYERRILNAKNEDTERQIRLTKEIESREESLTADSRAREIGNARLDAIKLSLDQLKEDGRISQEVYAKQIQNLDFDRQILNAKDEETKRQAELNKEIQGREESLISANGQAQREQEISLLEYERARLMLLDDQAQIDGEIFRAEIKRIDDQLELFKETNELERRRIAIKQRQDAQAEQFEIDFLTEEREQFESQQQAIVDAGAQLFDMAAEKIVTGLTDAFTEALATFNTDTVRPGLELIIEGLEGLHDEVSATHEAIVMGFEKQIENLEREADFLESTNDTLGGIHNSLVEHGFGDIATVFRDAILQNIEERAKIETQIVDINEQILKEEEKTNDLLGQIVEEITKTREEQQTETDEVNRRNQRVADSTRTGAQWGAAGGAVLGSAFGPLGTLLGAGGGAILGAVGGWLTGQVRNFFNFQRGGYTGMGSPNDVAGIVHRGEFVLPANVAQAVVDGRPVTINNDANQAQNQRPVTVIVVRSQQEITEAMSSTEGEQIIVDAMARNGVQAVA